MNNNSLLLTWSGSKISTLNQTWNLVSQSLYGESSMNVPVQTPLELEYYLNNYTYLSAPWGVVDPRFPLLAFSYGEGGEVNKQLASHVVTLMTIHSKLEALLQWEIAELVSALAPSLSSRVQSIGFSEGETYMTTLEVAAKALKLTSQRKMNLVAQLWHASRCIRQSEEQGWHCISLRGVDAFAPNDPQQWVRHPLNWLVKESRFRYMERMESHDVV